MNSVSKIVAAAALLTTLPLGSAFAGTSAPDYDAQARLTQAVENRTAASPLALAAPYATFLDLLAEAAPAPSLEGIVCKSIRAKIEPFARGASSLKCGEVVRYTISPTLPPEEKTHEGRQGIESIAEELKDTYVLRTNIPQANGGGGLIDILFKKGGAIEPGQEVSAIVGWTLPKDGGPAQSQILFGKELFSALFENAAKAGMVDMARFEKLLGTAKEPVGLCREGQAPVCGK